MEYLEGAVEGIKSLVLGERGTKDKWEENNRYESFAPEREKCHANWYVDAKDYFYAVSEALLSAKEEIFIEDWWLSPELYLRRPPSKIENEEYRLDRILKKKALEGVKIYVVVYKEMSQALTLDSAHSKQVLQSLIDKNDERSKNILVQRHPDHDIAGGTFFWAHHEKMVVVDRHIAFIGGLDLCFGRYDTSTHQLADYHKASKNISVWPGQDYSNPRIKDFTDVKEWAKALIDKKVTARMPWHDVSIGFVGRPANDVARHFIQRWNFIKKEKAENSPEYPVLIAKSDRREDHDRPPQTETYKFNCGERTCHPHKGTCNVQIIRSSAKWSHGLHDVEHSIQNAYIKIIEEAKHFIYIENQFFITATKESKDYPVKNLIGKAIVDRIILAHKNQEQFRIIVAMPLLPAFPADLDTSDAGTVRLVIHYQYQSICRGGQSILEVLRSSGVVNPEKYIGFYSLRNYDRIFPEEIEKGLGKLKEENEMGSAVDASATPRAIVDKDPSESFITEELYIHTKLLIADDKFVICGSANLNDRSQNGDHDSEIAAVIEDKEYIDSKMAGQDWKAGKYAATLRRHIFKEHLGLLEESVDNHHEDYTIASNPPPLKVVADYNDQANKTNVQRLSKADKILDPASDELKVQGLSEADKTDVRGLSEADKTVLDPASDEFYYNTWQRTATVNTEAFRNVFHCVPDDTVTNWDKFKAFVPDKTKVPTGHIFDPESSTAEEELSKVKGHLVHFPLQFMSGEKLSGSVVFDSVTPMELFT